MLKVNVEEFDYYTNLFEYVINKKLCEEMSVENKLTKDRFASKHNQADTFWSKFLGKEFIVSKYRSSYGIF